MAENGSSEALQVENPKAHDEEEEGEEGEEEEEEEEFEESEDGEEEGEDEAGHGELRVSELRGSVPTGEAVLRKPHSETLAAPSSLQLSENNQRTGRLVLFYVLLLFSFWLCDKVFFFFVYLGFGRIVMEIIVLLSI